MATTPCNFDLDWILERVLPYSTRERFKTHVDLQSQLEDAIEQLNDQGYVMVDELPSVHDNQAWSQGGDMGLLCGRLTVVRSALRKVLLEGPNQVCESDAFVTCGCLSIYGAPCCFYSTADVPD